MEDLKRKVEDLGVLLESFRNTPIEGRVFAYLLLVNPPYSSFDDIVEFLQASKGAVSKALNTFQKEGTISYKTFSGDRKRYFYINVDGWRNKFEDGAKKLLNANKLLEEAIEYRKDFDSTQFNTKIKEIKEFQDHLTKWMNMAIEDWKKH